MRPTRLLLRRDNGFLWVKHHPLSTVSHVLAVLWGDVNNDGRLDAYLCRRGKNQLWLQGQGRAWKEVAEVAGVTGGDHDTTGGLLADIDHDGDLDLLLTHADAALEVLMNRLDGTFQPLPGNAGLGGTKRPATGIIAADIDRDRDVDLLVLHDAPPHEVFVNDRLWQWRRAESMDALLDRDIACACVTDADADGQIELVVTGRNGAARGSRGNDDAWQVAAVPHLASDAQVLGLVPVDLDGDAQTDILLTGHDGWHVRLRDPAREKVKGRGAAVAPFVWSATEGYALVGIGPDGTPLLWRPGSGRHEFAALTFSGKQQKSDQMRSNAAGIGVRVAARVASTWTVTGTLRIHTGSSQSYQPWAVGLAGESRIDFVDLLWPDGLLQTESDLAPGIFHRIEETQRQTSSCPVLFAWDGSRYAFVTDLLGVGGLGFWVAPDTYAPPAPQESLLLPAKLLKPRSGALEFKLSEPMEEACYLDGAVLEVIDVPPHWQITVDDRMAVEGPAPTGSVVYYRKHAAPTSAQDQTGRDVLYSIRHIDLLAAPVAPLDSRFIGRTKEQVLTLTFAESLDRGPGTPTLVADGWIEYPYAQTLFAAWQAGAAYEAPTIEAKGADGEWRVVHKQYGYPAGMPRESSVPLRELPRDTRALRIRTTQEVYWDRLLVAWAEDCQDVRRRTLALREATLGEVGFAARTTGPQRTPHYDYERSAPLWNARHQAGYYTRFGRVDELLAHADDAVVIFGPGEEVTLRFDAPEDKSPSGWTRRYVLRTTGWCKDMDLFTKDGESIGPLPVRSADGHAHPARKRIHPRYQTRYRSGR